MNTSRFAWLAVAAACLVSAKAVADDVPAFMKETYPKPAIAAAVQEMAVLEGPDAVLPAKQRELIGLAVAATVPCHYCIYYHTKAAKNAGATAAELKEALAHAAQVRKWSTVLNGTMYDMEAFRKEVDAAFSGK